jgi:hypothetical protein
MPASPVVVLAYPVDAFAAAWAYALHTIENRLPSVTAQRYD